MIRRILTCALCLGLLAPVAVNAKDKRKKNNQDAKQTVRQQAKASKRANAQRRGGKPAANVRRQTNRNRAIQNQARRNRVIPSRVNRGRANANNNNRGRAFRNSNVQAQTQRNAVRRQANRNGNRNRNLGRRGPSNHRWSFAEARRHHRHGRHNRSWYRSNFARFALFAGGYYYFDRGYWYPAYGYDPAYSTYIYDEPIYGYNGLDPHEVIVKVQVQLQREGYNVGPVDGLLGPQTRSALADFQRDLGLDVTRSIDGPTLGALGLV